MSIEGFNAKAEELKDSIMNLYDGDTSYADDMNLIAGICKMIDDLCIAYADTKEDANLYLKTAEDLQDKLTSLKVNELKEKGE